MEMMHGSLKRLQNVLSELVAEDLLARIRLSAPVTRMVKNFFSLTRQEDPMPTQLEYGIRRTARKGKGKCKGTGGENVSWAFPLLHRAQKLLSGLSIGFSSSSQAIYTPNRRSNGETIP